MTWSSHPRSAWACTSVATYGFFLSSFSVERYPLQNAPLAGQGGNSARAMLGRCQLFLEMVMANPVCSHCATCLPILVYHRALCKFAPLSAAGSSQRSSILVLWPGRSSLLLLLPPQLPLLRGLTFYQGVVWLRCCFWG